MGRGGIDDLADFLRGTWRIERAILDGSGATTGRFEGWGRFEDDTEVPGLLRYAEHGTVHLGAYRGPAVRRLGYHVQGPRAQVVFSDGRPFHDLDLRDGTDEVEHPCRADRYRGRFEVVSDQHWWHDWTVTGPSKQQRIRTDLERADREACCSTPLPTGRGLLGTSAGRSRPSGG